VTSSNYITLLLHQNDVNFFPFQALPPSKILVALLLKTSYQLIEQVQIILSKITGFILFTKIHTLN